MNRKNLAIALLAIVGVACVTSGVTTLLINKGEHEAFNSTMERAINAFLANRGETIGQKKIRERVIQLPEDGGKWYTTLLLHKDYKDSDKGFDRELRTWFEVQPELVSLKTQTHFNVIQVGSKAYAQWEKRGYTDKNRKLPAVIVTHENGKSCYRASGANIPADPGVLADEIAQKVSDCSPRPNPTPPAPVTPGPNNGPPDLRPSNSGGASGGGDSGLGWGGSFVAIAAGVLLLGVGLVKHLKN